MRRPAHIRVLSRIRHVRGCWVFQGALDEGGYGRVHNPDGSKIAHRVVYEALIGPIGNGLKLDHLCRVRSCCNPLHLEPVDDRTNVLRGETIPAVNAAKTHCVRGHPFDPVNTYRYRGRRYCRLCKREHKRAYRERSRA